MHAKARGERPVYAQIRELSGVVCTSWVCTWIRQSPYIFPSLETMDLYTKHRNSLTTAAYHSLPRPIIFSTWSLANH